MNPQLNIRKKVSAVSGGSEIQHTKKKITEVSEEQKKILKRLYKSNPLMEEFKKSVVIPFKIKEMIELCESTVNPKG